MALAFLATVAEIPFMPASSAAIPNLAAPEDLAWANGRIASAIATGITIGPVVAGGLVAVFGPSLAFALNALSFVLSAAIVSTVHGQFADRDRAPDEDHGSARAGVDFVRRSAALRTIVLAEFVAFIGVGLIIVSDAPLAQHFDVGAVGYGLLVAVWGARHDRRRVVGRAGAEGASRAHGAARGLAGDRRSASGSARSCRGSG